MLLIRCARDLRRRFKRMVWYGMVGVTYDILKILGDSQNYYDVSAAC